MEPGKSWLRTADRLAVALLVAGCAVGMAGLLLRPDVPLNLPPTPQEQRLRLHELESRLQEAVAKTVAQRYGDL